MPGWLEQLVPIAVLLGLIVIVVWRVPKVDLGHSDAYKRRRFLNWFPLGMTYAFLYMGRYNLTVSKNALGDLMSKADFGTIFFFGTLTYGFSFIINGPLTDKLGGRKTIMISAAGSAAMNLLLGVVTWGILSGASWAPESGLVPMFSVIYAANMYFQSFGAVSIVKVNASWFHVRERGMIGGVFGILISLGVYFAYDWGGLIVNTLDTWWVFFVPAGILLVFLVIDYFLVFDEPGDTGHPNFDVADASSGDDGPPLPVLEVAKKMLSNPIIVTIALIEFCSGFLRNAIMQWYIIFAKEVSISDTVVPSNWGLLLCMAGITGGMFAGVISDKVFGSRRGPVASILYGGMILGAFGLIFVVAGPAAGWVAVFMSMCVIGVHGMLSGTASMDFGGRKNAGVAVGLIDGLVYLGTATQAITLGLILPSSDRFACAATVDGSGNFGLFTCQAIVPVSADASNWTLWPVAMLPLAIIGFALALRIWRAMPKGKGGH